MDAGKDCTNAFHHKVVHFFLLAGSSTVVFVILSLDFVQEAFMNYFFNKTSVLIAKALVFFAVVYLLDRFIEKYRVRHVVCV
jgi:hypothetical protein